jgi:hypothetical protein
MIPAGTDHQYERIAICGDILLRDKLYGREPPKPAGE